MLYTLLVLFCFGQASGGEISLRADDLPPRSYKFEVYHYAPVGEDRSSLDWRPTDAEIWSGLLDCVRAEPWVDVCRLREGRVVYTFHIDDEPVLSRHSLRLPGEIVLEHSPNGRIKRWDIRGPMEDFWQDASQAVLASFRDPRGRMYTPDDQRRIGQRMEEQLSRRIRSAFEVPLPSKSTESTWKIRGSLWATKALDGDSGPYFNELSHNSISSLTGTGAVLEADDRIATVGFEARVKESVPDQTVSGLATGMAQLDSGSGALMGNAVRVTYRNQVLGGFSRRLALLERAREDMTPFPGELAGNPLESTP